MQKWKACPGVRLHYQAEQQAANFGARHKTTKEEPNKEPRPGARNGKEEEELKRRNRKEQKEKEGGGRERERKPSLASHPIPCARINPREKKTWGA